jgi:hypothetical protein
MKVFVCKSCSYGPCKIETRHPEAHASFMNESCVGVGDGIADWEEVPQEPAVESFGGRPDWA